ncbi:MAG: DUF3341 domain-containing protein [Desulfobacteraceae bacterium]|nr:DUF3341 domain-containing protein [Desulfobacteraceae bacterium]
MAVKKISVLGMFADENAAASAVKGLKNTDWSIDRVHGPIPSHKILDALGMKKSRVGWFTLGGGITGFFTGFLLAAFTATRWSLIVGGKPVVALVPFFIVGFEFTILFAVFGNIIGLITQMKLPDYTEVSPYNIRFTGDRFGILTHCDAGRKAELINLLRAKGAEVEVVEGNDDKC